MKNEKPNALKLLKIGAVLLPGMTVLDLAGMIEEWNCHGFDHDRCVAELARYNLLPGSRLRNTWLAREVGSST